MSSSDLGALPAKDEESKLINVVVETPKGCRNKYKFDQERKAFLLKKVLPLGADFPFDFGFIPSTSGEDGDPLDVLVLMDEPVFAGCVVEARLVGVIEAKQTEKGKSERNDRLIAVAEEGELYKNVESIKDLPAAVLEQIEHFFISYNEQEGKEFKVLKHGGKKAAAKLMWAGMKKFLKG
jgi:inorganic pyrophosphatase